MVIANYLNRAPATISYELARYQPYQANLAQADAERKRAHCGRIGDFEIDTVVGPRVHSKAVLLTLIDCKPRFFWAYLLKDRTVYAVNEALFKSIFTFKGPIHSLTVDCGTDFSGLDVFETQYGIHPDYRHDNSPDECHRNERFNRILRYFYLKGTCFEHVSAQELSKTLLEINQQPFKVLNWQTPYQVLLDNSAKDSD